MTETHHTHHEEHFTAPESVRDVVIGMADGLTVPFALAAGLAGIAEGTGIIVTAGLAEIAAGAIAMGLGGYLAARSEVEHYASEYRREMRETVDVPDVERREVAAVFRRYGLHGDTLTQVVDAIASDRKRWVDFMMRFELGLNEPDPKRAPVSAATIGASYVVGGLIPLAPYMLVDRLSDALVASVLVTLVALFVFGAMKGRMTGMSALKSGLQTLFVGAAAAAAAYGIAAWLG